MSNIIEGLCFSPHSDHLKKVPTEIKLPSFCSEMPTFADLSTRCNKLWA